MTDTKNILLPKTNEAISELSSALAHLNEVLDGKKKEVLQRQKKFAADIKLRDKKIEAMKSSYAQIIDNVDSVINRLDKVLEKDGSGNNHN
ncbi:MAG: hypothetical protein J6L86_08865 [Alphaproteobacteria bacterium]|nr:hypothetical protein [Alphaproteobacteria bacterium]MBQ8631835.1 hypothetical protein [Alphaproteobacteria bacterium]